MTHQPQDDLTWSAYQYAAGELDAAAAAAFEERLAVDQSAREALAEAVSLSEAVCAAYEQLPASYVMPASRVAAPADSRLVVGWLATATAACIALAMTWQAFKTPAGDEAGEVAAAQAEADSQLLAALGPEHRWDAPSPLVDELAAADNVIHEESVSEELDASEASTDPMSVAAPDWLLAAVVESSQDGANE
ncbi:MAG: hypothetical protein QM775_19315 [Pirellulales bacterium]